MLTLNIETSLQLTDDASLNAADGVIATVFDDPNKMSVTDYTEWFSTRISTLASFADVVWTPHFTAKFAILETNQTVDIELELPASVRYMTAQYGFGSVQNTTPDTLHHGQPVFANVIPTDILTVISGSNAVIGDVVVIAVIDDYTVQVASPIYTGVGTASDFVFRVKRNLPVEIATLRNVSKLHEIFMPFTSIKVTNVTFQAAAVRCLFLG